MDSKRLLEKAYGIAIEKGLSGSRWSTEAGHSVNGQTVFRILKNGNCKLTTLISLLDVLGCELDIKEKNNF